MIGWPRGSSTASSARRFAGWSSAMRMQSLSSGLVIRGVVWNLGFSLATLAQSSGNENACRAGSDGPPARRHGWVPGGEAIIFSVVPERLPAARSRERPQAAPVRSPPDRLVALLERPSGDASDDQQLAGDVAAREILARASAVMSDHLLRGGR